MPKISRNKAVNLEARAQQLRRGIRAAQLRVALDEQRGRVTPEAVVRVANRKLPEVTMITDPLVRAEKLPQGTMTVRVGPVWAQRARRAQESTDANIRSVAASGPASSPSEEISKAKALLDSGAISAAEFDRIKSETQQHMAAQ